MSEITANTMEIEGKYSDESYTRFDSDNWFMRMGESLEPVFDCVDIEKEYQRRKEAMTIDEIRDKIQELLKENGCVVYGQVDHSVYIACNDNNEDDVLL